MADKEFKKIDEQLDILKSRGLIINDVNKAKEFLLKNNYYRVSGYSLTLRQNDVFYPNASMQNISDIYNFDHEFRHILLKYIEIIEVSLKSIYAYELTRAYGPTGYLDAANFTDEKQYEKTFNKAEKQKLERLPHELYLKHFIEERQEPIPSGHMLICLQLLIYLFFTRLRSRA